MELSELALSFGGMWGGQIFLCEHEAQEVSFRRIGRYLSRYDALGEVALQGSGPAIRGLAEAR